MNKFEIKKPIYLFDKEKNCGIINYGSKIYYMNLEDRDNILNFNKKFVFYSENDLYPYYNYNEQKINYLMFLYNFKENNVDYIFKNNDPFDLRRSNVVCFHIFHKNIIENYNVIDYIPGHFSKNGVDPYYMKNPIWKIKDKENEYFLMYCEKNIVCKLCPISYQKIFDYEIENNHGKKLTFHKHANGYILCSNKCLYIHQIITGCFGNGKGTLNISVDHIDQDTLNNTWENLRIATRKEQEQNSKGIKDNTKRERKTSAKELPKGITQNKMRKYVVYYQEWLDKEHTKEREFFKIEKHPKLDKSWATTKSNKVTIEEKLAQANKVVDDLENDIYPEKKEIELPKYVSFIIMRLKPHLVFEKRIDNKRLNLKMILPEQYELSEQLTILNQKIKEKYDEELTIY